MQKRRAQNLAVALKNPNENWLYDELCKTPHTWIRQKVWGFRVFDFYCQKLGVAIELDGNEHKRHRAFEDDHRRDIYAFHKSGIIVYRIQNGSYSDLNYVLSYLDKVGKIKDRKKINPLDEKLYGIVFQRDFFLSQRVQPSAISEARQCKGCQHLFKKNGRQTFCTILCKVDYKRSGRKKRTGTIEEDLQHLQNQGINKHDLRAEPLTCLTNIQFDKYIPQAKVDCVNFFRDIIKNFLDDPFLKNVNQKNLEDCFNEYEIKKLNQICSFINKAMFEDRRKLKKRSKKKFKRRR